MKKRAVGRAPATVANVAVGFDILGFAFGVANDEVTVTVLPGSKNVVVHSIGGISSNIPTDPFKNTAAVALRAMIEDLGLDHGFEIEIKKGIPLSSGMGGSAASAVAAVIAANELLPSPLSKEKLLAFSLSGEAVASGGIHADNVAPCLYGGMTLIISTDPLEVVALPVPKMIKCVLIRPHVEIETKQARAILKKEISLKNHVKQSSFLGGFISGCFKDDLGLIKKSMHDILIEEQRSKLIPGFGEAQKCALASGALGFSISGSGPSMFAWVSSEEEGIHLQKDLRARFEELKIGADIWCAPISKGASAKVLG